MPNGRARSLLAAMVLLAVAAPVVDLALSARERLFAYIATDAYYYFNVGRNLAQRGSLSFDGQRAINGFHPLWQLCVGAVFAAARPLGGGDHGVLLALFALQLALIGAALWLLGAALRRGDGGLSPLFPLLPLGVTAIAIAPSVAA